MSIPICPTCATPAATHPAGWCLDAWVHKYIMGGKGEAPEYSTDIAAAFEVWRKAVRRGWCSIVSDSGGVQVKMKGLRVEIAEADVAEEPLAICRAALMAKAKASRIWWTVQRLDYGPGEGETWAIWIPVDETKPLVGPGETGEE